MASGSSRSSLAALSAYSFISELAPSSKERVAATLQVHRSDAGQDLLARGDRAGGAYLLAEGRLRVYHLTSDGRESTLYWIEPGETCLLAMNCIFAEMRYPAWVSAETPSVVCVIPAETYKALFGDDVAVQRFTFDQLSSRVFELMDLLAEALSAGLEQRLASLLLRVADEQGRAVMTQEMLAKHLGTAREVVSRLLRGWVAQGIVRTSRGAVELVDEDALIARSDG